MSDQIIILTIAVTLAFAFGLIIGASHERSRRRRRQLYSEFGNFMPLPNPDPQFDEEYWIHHPPKFPMGGSAGERR